MSSCVTPSATRPGRAPARRKRPGLLGLALGCGLACAGCGERIPAPAGAGPLRLVDATSGSGLPVRGMTSGAALLDLDGDGYPDLLLGRHAGPPEAYRNLGGLRFAADPGPADAAGIDVLDHHATLADDLDGDGRCDLYLVTGACRGEGIGRNALLLGGEAFARDVAAERGVQDPYGRGRGALLLDVDGDAGRDLLVLNFRTAPRAYDLTGSAAAADRARDLLGCPAADDEVVARAGPGDASARARRRGEFVHTLLPRDVDADGRVDLLALGVPPIRLLRQAAGRLRAAPLALPPEAGLPEPAAGAWGDLDGDGRPDLYLVYGADDAPSHHGRPRRNRLLLWRGERLDESPDPAPGLDGRGVACAAADLDNDGALDLLVLQACWALRTSRLRVLLNRGDGRFVETGSDAPFSAPMSGVGDGLLAADLDRDGDLDVLVLLGKAKPDAPGGGVRLLRNDLAAGGWLDVRLEAQRPAYGARVEVVAAGRRQVRQHWPTQVAGSACALPVHFGLAGARRVTRLTVHWPWGGATELRDLAANRQVVVRP